MRRTILSFAILAIASPAGVRPAAAQSGDEGSYPETDSIPADGTTPADEYAPADEGDEATYDDPAYDEPAYDDTAADEPAADEPVYDEPAYDTPADEPVYDAGSSYADDSVSASSSASVPPANPVETFRDTLSPYGRWVRTAEFGVVWVPSRSIVGADFVPYGTGGSWRYSTAGWLFASDWDWGWAPFHYGRWYRQYPYGWVWVPGRVWAPAWVDWRFGDGYIGWAPLPPRGYRVTRRDHRNWYFCSYRDMGRPHIQRHWVRSSPRIWRMTAAARNPLRHGRARWYRGPRPEQIERVTRSRLPRVHVAPPRAGVVARLRIQGDRSRIERVAPVRRQQQLERQRQNQTERQRQNQAERQRQNQAERQRQNQVERQRQQQVERQRQNQVERQRQQQFERQRQNQVERQRQNQAERQRQQQVERQQAQRQQQVERQRQQQVERQQAQRQQQVERQQAQRQQQFERQRQQQVERQQAQRQQQVERQRQQQVERQPRRQQQAERPRAERQQRQRVERPARASQSRQERGGRDRRR